MVSLFSDVRSILQEADRHDLRAHGMADELDLEEYMDLDEEEIDDIKKGFV